MAALSFPKVPETSRTGTPGFPELPAPPLGGGKNGKGWRVVNGCAGDAKQSHLLERWSDA